MTTTTYTTPESITDEQIEALRAESASAGDLGQTAMCDRALGDLDAMSRIDDPAGVSRALKLTQDEARAECARMINATAAMQD